MDIIMNKKKLINQMINKNQIKVIDLFCGVGGLTHGLSQVGLDVVAGFDFDESCKFAYEANNKAKFIHKDIREVSGQEIEELFGEVKYKILVGCAPCQPFSSYSNKNRIKNFDSQDTRWNLLLEFMRIIKFVQPEVISMENVPQLEKFPVFKEFIKELNSLNYSTTYQIINCSDIGLPQSRKRLVLLASKDKTKPFKLLAPVSKEKTTVRKAISMLEKINQGSSSSTDVMHSASKLTSINLDRIKASVPGKTWKEWPEHLLPKCYKKESGLSYGAVYGRMEWDKPAPTITTQFYTYGTGRFGHPEQDRAISLREGALLQGFPDNYQFVNPLGSLNIKTIARHIGNAVPPTLGNMLGKLILQNISKDN